ncbi:MAG: hypothetical protein ACRC2K_13420 [Clostridium sp.]
MDCSMCDYQDKLCHFDFECPYVDDEINEYEEDYTFALYLIDNKLMTCEQWNSKLGLNHLKFLAEYHYNDYKRYCKNNDLTPEKLYL